MPPVLVSDRALCTRFPSVCDGTFNLPMLMLPRESLLGTLPSEIGLLTDLTELDLS
jgi:hypothetical protein